jgi:hypothetical protein
MGRTMLTEEDLVEIRRRLEAATPGPWKAYLEGRDHTSGDSFIKTPRNDIYLDGGSLADLDFIAHARQDIPRLLDELQVLKAMISTPDSPR